MRRKGMGLPLALGVITCALLALVLWPKQEPQVTVVVAARDLGAGLALAASDLTTAVLPATGAPADALADPAALVGQSLAVVRFAGEPVTPRHLGPAVSLRPDERGIAVQVKADTGLAGLLRPGMQVGVIATLTDAGVTRAVYAKTVLEGLRVLYVPPDFQGRPYTPATAAATVSKSGGSATGDSATTTTSAGSSGTVREGVLVLAASTQAQPIRYEAITDTLKLAAALGITNTVALTTTVAPTPTPAARTAAAVKPAEPPVRWVVPVELLAALNAAGDSLTRTRLPGAPQAYITAGVNLSDVAAPTAEPEIRR